jgi:hypothetical protein
VYSGAGDAPVGGAEGLIDLLSVDARMAGRLPNDLLAVGWTAREKRRGVHTDDRSALREKPECALGG